ncbi:MAG: biotin-dependent carboxyltransferase family protein [Tagaea sp.]|nr:biotin-dependent carboxyltransferase family protein [Tagaea sp.]
MSATLFVEASGPATSVQDAGRAGFLRFGLSSAGAMDRFALAAANALVGAAPAQAAIEIGPLPARLAAKEAPVRIALAGAAREASASGRKIALARSFVLAPGETLTLGAARGGLYTYLAAAGGILGPPAFGSLSVHARAGLGSPIARPLRAGDALPVAADPGGEDRHLPVPAPETGPIRVVLGPQDDYFSAPQIDAFLGAEWRVALASDRMGYRLDGPKIAAARGHNIVSDGIANGAIQIPGGGQPLVLLADRGTTGGYPKIACIATCDLGRFAQTPPGTALRFEAIGVDAAQGLARAFEASLEGLRARAIAGGGLTSEALLAANVAGRAVSALDGESWGD